MRFLKVVGNGHPVSNPHAPNAEPRRYAGHRRRVGAPSGQGVLAFYEPTEETLPDHASLRRAIDKGQLRLLSRGEGQTADSVVWRNEE